MERKLKALCVSVVLGLGMLSGGCASTSADKTAGGTDGRLLVAPLLPDYKHEVSLARLNEVLGTMELTEDQLARVYYERGVIYDTLGLRLMARLDFHQALKIRPNIADAYNFLGIYYTQEGDFDNAYEAFDAVLELEPEYDYAYLNRGIALYYGERNDLALTDMDMFLRRNPADGYRALWYFLIDAETDRPAALNRLATHRQALNNDEWATVMADYYLGKVTAPQIFEKAKQGLNHPREYSERLCEAYFYIAKAEVAAGRKESAASYFRLALATNIYDFVEHRYARVELGRMANEAGAEIARP
ncbi:lipoprotein NlpI [Shewanella sp. JM162201]|uniref:Lipoprotein NlpI n=1 Tax=Shewanella jiangmenensis TaxID=2837387 RepID=A0ABS5V1J8_9GAMM|nr:lipoprotein NlpI [Shewanella jiangmenensis]MBT1443476.1 lipoprotein NlpI [Shewanella jiangmenensis]